MSVTTQVTTFSDIFTEILNKMRQPTNITAISNQAKRYANTALYDLVLGFEYQLPWLERDATLITMAPYTTGTVSITRGTTTLNGAATLWTTANVYGVNNARTIGKIILGDSNIYTISSITDGTTIVLNERYIANGNLAAGSSYTYFEDAYALASDYLKPIDTRIFTSAYNIPIIGRNKFKQMFPRPNISGTPKVCTLLDKPFNASTTQVKHVQFYPYPSAVFRIPYSYVTNNLSVTSAGVEQRDMSGDTDEPNLPLPYRHLIVLGAIAAWYRDKKDDARGQAAYAEYQQLLLRMVGSQDIGAATQAQIQPKIGLYAGYARRPYGGRARGKRYSTDNRFDSFQD